MKIKYSPHLISYIDILGFKELILSTKKLSYVHKTLKDSQKHLLIKGILYNKKNDIEFGQFSFSDLIVRAINISKDLEIHNYQNILAKEIIIIGLAQSQLIQSNETLIRGAVTISDLYFNTSESIIVGPGLINAYYLENQIAVNPRIIIDPFIISKIGENFFRFPFVDTSNLNIEDEFFGNVHTYAFLKKDVDGIYFINYLEVVLNIVYLDDTESWIEYIQNHKSFIEKAEKKFCIHPIKQSQLSIYKKLSWLKNYHNWFINHKIDYSRERGHLSDLDSSFLIS